MKFDWENIYNFDSSFDEGLKTCRAKVFGGWVLRTICWDDESKTQSESSVFIPDIDHQWKITENTEDDILGKMLCNLDWERNAPIVRIVTCLNAENIFTVRDVAQVSRKALCRIPNFGLKSIRCLEEELRKHGISLNEGLYNDMLGKKYPIKYIGIK